MEEQSKEVLHDLYARIGKDKVLSDLVDIIKENSIYEHEFGIVSQEESFIPMVLPIPDGEELMMKMKIICKATNEFIISEILIRQESISWAKDSLAFMVARVLIKTYPTGIQAG